jgi:hypothetical protein
MRIVISLIMKSIGDTHADRNGNGVRIPGVGGVLVRLAAAKPTPETTGKRTTTMVNVVALTRLTSSPAASADG